MVTLYKLDDPYEIKCSLHKDALCTQVLGISDITKWNPDFTRASWFLIKDNNEDVGFIFFRDISGSIITFHAGIYKKYRHKNTAKILKVCLDGIKAEVNCNLITTIDTQNIPALKVAEKMGFTILKTFKDIDRNTDIALLTE